MLKALALGYAILLSLGSRNASSFFRHRQRKFSIPEHQFTALSTILESFASMPFFFLGYFHVFYCTSLLANSPQGKSQKVPPRARSFVTNKSGQNIRKHMYKVLMSELDSPVTRGRIPTNGWITHREY